MTETQLRNLLEAYSLEEILEAAGLDTLELLILLEEQRYLDNLNLPEPL